MSKLTAAERRAEPASVFAGPDRSFPIPDKGHARAALKDVSFAKNLTPAERAHIRAEAHAKLADHHLAMHAHHAALAAHHHEKGEADPAKLHNGLAHHHMGAAEAHHNIGESYEGSAADEAQDRAGAAKAGMSLGAYEGSAQDRREDAAGQRKASAGADPLAVGAAHQLHRKGHLDDKTHSRIVKSAGGQPTAKPKRKPFGSLSGSGHYMGDVDTADSAGTNSGM